MKQHLLLASTIVVVSMVSCAPSGANRYDTQPSTGDDAPAAPSDNPIYDSTAAYEDNGGSHTAVNNTAVPHIDPTPVEPPASPRYTAPASAAPGSAIIHTVVSGDTLSGLSDKYNVPMAQIKMANHMTSDTVVLGRKMVIPPRH